jgi:hypothetical protein
MQMTEPPTTDTGQPQIPQSTALTEAQTDSLAELLSRDPEGYSDHDLTRVIAAFREQRTKWEAADAQAKADSPAKKKSAVKAEDMLQKTATINAEDLGL